MYYLDTNVIIDVIRQKYIHNLKRVSKNILLQA